MFPCPCLALESSSVPLVVVAVGVVVVRDGGGLTPPDRHRQPHGDGMFYAVVLLTTVRARYGSLTPQFAGASSW